MRRGLVAAVALLVGLLGAPLLPSVLHAGATTGAVSPTLAGPQGQDAVKSGDLLTFGGSAPASSTLVAANLVFLDSSGNPARDDLDATGQVQISSGGSISGNYTLPSLCPSPDTADDCRARLNGGTVVLSVTVDSGGSQATGRSNGVALDMLPPYIARTELIAPDKVRVTFSEGVTLSGGAKDSPADWTIDGTCQTGHPVLAIDGQGSTRTLTLSLSEDEDATPLVDYCPLPNSAVYRDSVGRTLSGGGRDTTAIDRIAPAVPAITQINGLPSNNALGNDPSPTVQVSGLRSGHVGQVYVESDGTPGLQRLEDTFLGEAAANASGAATVQLPDLGTDATYALYGVARDTALCAPPGGTARCPNYSGADNATYHLDMTAPAPLYAVAEGATGATQDVKVKFSEPVQGTDGAAQWSVSEGGPVTGISGSGATRTLQALAVPAGATLTWTPPAAGAYTDQAGNALHGFSTTVLDGVPPVVSLSAPVDQQYLQAHAVTVAGSVTEGGTTVSIYRDDNGNGQPDETALASTTLGSSATSFSFNVSLPNDSSTLYLVQAVDGAGNVGPAVATPRIVQDSTAPTLDITSPASDTLVSGSGNLDIEWDAVDTNFGSGPITIELSMNGGSTWQPVGGRANDGQYQLNMSTLTGVHSTTNALVRITATDQAGWTTRVVSEPFAIDAVPPAFGAVTVDAQHVAVQFTEPVGGTLAADEWTINGVPAAGVMAGAAPFTTVVVQSVQQIGGDDRPSVKYTPSSVPGRQQIADPAGNAIPAGARQVEAEDGIVPAAPSIDAIAGQAPGSTGNDPTPDVSVGGIIQGDTATVFVESDGTPGYSSGDREVGHAVAGANGATVTTSNLGADGNYVLYATAVDPSGNPSAGAGHGAYGLDTSVPTALSATSDGSAITVTFSEAVTGTDSPAQWTVSRGGTTYQVSGVSGSGATRVLSVSSPGDVTVAWAKPAAGGYADGAGNAVASFSKSTLDKAIPTLAVTAPSGSVVTGATTYHVTGTTDGSSVELFRDTNNDGSPDGSAVATANASAGSFNVSAPLTADASNDFVIRALKASGVKGAFADVPTIVQDSTGPSVSVLAPTGGEDLAGGSTYAIRWSASDPHLSGTPVELDSSTDGGSTWTTIATGQANDGSYDWTVPGSANTDAAQVRVVVRDTAGNLTRRASPSFAIDSTTPTFTATTVDAQTVHVTFSEAMTGAASGTDWTLDGVPFSSAQGSGGDTFAELTLTAANANAIGPNAHPSVAYAPHGAQIADRAGNQIQSDSRTVTAADGIAPGAPRLDQCATLVSSNGITFTGTADGGNRVVVVRTDPTNDRFAADVRDDGTFAVPVQLAPDATNDFEVRVVDPDGNTSSSVPVRVDQDSMAPQITRVALRGLDRSHASIRWDAAEAHPDFVRLVARAADSRHWISITKRTDPDGRYTWVVPATLRGRTVVVKVVEFDLVGHRGSAASTPRRI